jgi:hypothetical protein
MATKVEDSSASAAFTVGVRGNTRSSNLGWCEGAPSNGGEGGGEGRMWRDREPSGVATTYRPSGVPDLQSGSYWCSSGTAKATSPSLGLRTVTDT